MTIEKVNVDIPEFFLLAIAVHGNMGDGKLPDIMRTWAQKECRRLGLEAKMKELQDDRLHELEMRLRNVIGDDAINQLHENISKVVKNIGKLD